MVDISMIYSQRDLETILRAFENNIKQIIEDNSEIFLAYFDGPFSLISKFERFQQCNIEQVENTCL